MISMIIEYDLRTPGRNYDELYKAIKNFSECIICESFLC